MKIYDVSSKLNYNEVGVDVEKVVDLLHKIYSNVNTWYYGELKDLNKLLHRLESNRKECINRDDIKESKYIKEYLEISTNLDRDIFRRINESSKKNFDIDLSNPHPQIRVVQCNHFIELLDHQSYSEIKPTERRLLKLVFQSALNDREGFKCSENKETALELSKAVSEVLNDPSTSESSKSLAKEVLYSGVHGAYNKAVLIVRFYRYAESRSEGNI